MEKKKTTKTVLLRITALTGLGILLLASVVAIGTPTRTTTVATPVSWNPDIAGLNRFHAPISSSLAEMLFLTNARIGDPVLSLQQQQQQNNISNNTNTGMRSIPVNALRFINDNSYMSQTETTVAVDPFNTTHIVGGVRDTRWYFCHLPSFSSIDCPSGWTVSLSGFTTSSDGGRSVAKSDELPGLNDSLTGVFLISAGDSSVAATLGGKFYYAALVVDPTTRANGVQLSISNSNLWSTSSDCVTSRSTPWTNPCWSTTLVYGNLTKGANSMEDKDSIAVDMNPNSSYYGDAYVAWDHYYANGTSASYLARCDMSLTCVMLSGGPKPPISRNISQAAFPFVTVDSNSNVHVAFLNYGVSPTTLDPITAYVTNSPPGGTGFGTLVEVFSFMGEGTMMPNAYVTNGFATEQFRTIGEYGVITSDHSGATNNLYWTMSVCVAGDYYPYKPITVAPGDCGSSAIVFSKSTNGGQNWTLPTIVSDTTNVNVQPWVTVDSTTGEVSVVYYTTAYDQWHHRTDVVSTSSTNGGSTWTTTRLTNVSDEVDSDPTMYNWTAPHGVGGSFVPVQYGDYFEAVALGGKLYVCFTGSYTVEEGTFQADPYLLIAAG